MNSQNKRSKYQQILQNTLAQRVSEILSDKRRTTENPVIKAAQVWKIVSTQLQDVLGDDVYKQWFYDIVPLVLADKVLILQTKNKITARWINAHYQPLVDLLLSFHDIKLSSFFICPSDNSGQAGLTSKSARSKVNS